MTKRGLDAKILLSALSVLNIIWAILVLVFLKDNMMVSIQDVIVSAILSTVAPIAIYSIFDLLLGKIKNDFSKYLIILLIFSAFFSVITLVTPYSPNHDSYDIEYILKSMLDGVEITGYNKAYTNFFATNKLVIYIYYPFVLLFGNVETGARIANAFFVWTASVGISAVVKQLKTWNAASFSLIAMLVLCPTLLFSGPYIYPPAIALSALAFAFYIHKEPFMRVFGYIFAGILFTVRPLSLGVFLVWSVLGSFVGKRKIRYKISSAVLKTSLIFIICLTTQWYVGQVMYKTNSHSAENLKSAMGLWTIEVGTRDQGDKTGFCDYAPISLSEDKKDDISNDFHTLWYLYEESDVNTNWISYMKGELSKKLFKRYTDEILYSPKTFWNFVTTKFTNYYRDYYKPYFYAVNLKKPGRHTLLYKNYDYRYCLYENVLLYIFFIAGLILITFSCIRIYKSKKTSRGDPFVIILFFGVICTAVVSILLTEVGKRLIFDSFVPMCIIICTALFPAAERFAAVEKKKYVGLIACLTLATVIGGKYFLYKSIEIPLLRKSNITIDEKRNVTIDFQAPVGDEGYVYIDSHQERHSMSGYDKLFVEYGSDEYVSKPVYFGIELPDSQLIYISYLE